MIKFLQAIDAAYLHMFGISYRRMAGIFLLLLMVFLCFLMTLNGLDCI